MHAPLVRACYKMRYFEPEIWDRIWPDVLATRRYRMKDETDILEIAAKLHDDPEFYNFQKLGDVLQKLEERFRGNAEHREWRYNLEERRYKTFEEMVAQRDRYLNTDQGEYYEIPGMKEMEEKRKLKMELAEKRRLEEEALERSHEERMKKR